MSNLVSVAAVPGENNFTFPQILEAAQVWLKESPTDFEVFKRFHQASRTTSRAYTLSLEEILGLQGQDERASLFAKHGIGLGCRAVEACLEKANMTPQDISSVIFTSCTSPLIPSIDAEILQRMGFSPNVKRVPIYQQGCAGGVIGFGLADRLSLSTQSVLLLSVELCSLLFRLKESSVVHILGSALFADGAAASIFSNETGRLRIIDTHSHLIPETSYLMGYDIRQDGAHLKLDRALPTILQNELKGITSNFLNKLQLQVADFPWWIIHPGGVKILDGIANILNLSLSQYEWAYDILSSEGNMSSATVQFVMSKFLAAGVVQPRDKIMMIGIGPGLTVELVAFEYE